MKRTTKKLLTSVAMLGVLGMVILPGFTQEKETASPAMTAKDSKESSFRGRLPNYYSRVVSHKQRQEIYRLQHEYHQQLAPLYAKIAALKAERDKKIEAVLTPDQLTEVLSYTQPDEQ
ncbi:Hypothetical protein PBC10988_26470 [Planctomycetales bacterium 10988]|nr:Hypothetical protein PBC10988_26470 [Planctomycetales bacterium 10988]